MPVWTDIVLRVPWSDQPIQLAWCLAAENSTVLEPWLRRLSPHPVGNGPSRWHLEKIAGAGFQCPYRNIRMYNVGHVSRCHTTKSFVCKQKNFEVYMWWMTGSQWRSKLGWCDPVFLREQHGGQISFGCVEVCEDPCWGGWWANYYNCQGVMIWKHERVFHKTVYQDIFGYCWSSSKQMRQNECDVVNIRSHSHVSVQNNTEVTSMRNKIDNCFSSSDVRDGRILSKTRSEMQNLGFAIVENKKVSGHHQALISDIHTLFNFLNCNRSLWKWNFMEI